MKVEQLDLGIMAMTPEERKKAALLATKPADIRRLVLAADDYQCANPYCVSREKRMQSGLHPHHIQPKSVGGSDTIENLISLCPCCHDKAHNGGFDYKAKRRVTAARFMVNVLDAYEGTAQYRWHNAHNYQQRLADKQEEMTL